MDHASWYADNSAVRVHIAAQGRRRVRAVADGATLCLCFADADAVPAVVTAPAVSILVVAPDLQPFMAAQGRAW